MTVHFITASRGGDDPHVTSADDARQNVAHIGNGNYVGKTGDQLSASMTSPNTLRILSGDGWICGRHWSVDGFEDVTIENGNPGYNRKDLVVFHAETSPSESGEIVVIKGEETTGDAVVPSYTEGDLNDGDTVAEMPLYVVSLNGVSVNDPEPQFDVLVPYAEFQSSIAQTPVKTAEIETGCTLYYYGDNTVEINVYDMIMSGINTWVLGTLDKLPHHKACMALCASDADHTGTLWVNDNGQVVCKHNITGSYHYSGNMRIPLS